MITRENNTKIDEVELHLNKIGSLLDLTDEVLGLNPDAWINELVDWANANFISAETFPRKKENILALTELRLNRSTVINTSLNNTQIINFPIELARLTNLTSLSLAGNNLISLPSFVTKLPNLQYLDLYDNALSTLPDSIAQLTKLIRLDLSHNLFTWLPDTLCLLTNLTDLYLGYNRLMVLPEAISRLKNLTHLSLIANPTLRLSHCIHHLTQLTYLDLRHNHLTSLHENYGKLHNLTSIDLSNNKLLELPEFIGQLSNLVDLKINNNLLADLPASFVNLVNLRDLNLSNNQFKHVPEVIGKLNNLSCLGLSGNALQEVPQFFDTLCKLTSLDLSNNNITKVPNFIKKLPLLSELNLYHQIGKDQSLSSEDIKLITLLRELRFEEGCFRKLIDERVSREWEINQFEYLFMKNLGELIAQIFKLRLQAMINESCDEKITIEQNYQCFLALQQEILNNPNQDLSEADQQLLRIIYHKAAGLCIPCKLNNEYIDKGGVIFKELNHSYLNKDIENVQKIYFNIKDDPIFTNLEYYGDDIEVLQKKIYSFHRLSALLGNKINIILKNRTYQHIQKVGNLNIYIEDLHQSLSEQIVKLQTECHCNLVQ